jgi:hypothetical protein
LRYVHLVLIVLFTARAALSLIRGGVREATQTPR